MNCKQCGQPLPEGTAFCSFCGAKQDVAVQSSAQPQMPPQAQPQMYYEVKMKQKKKKNPIVPVILNLIALLLLFSMNLNAAFKDQPDNFIGISVYLLFIPLLLSIGVLLLKNSTVKLIISAIELVLSICIVLIIGSQSGGLFFLLLIFEIIVSSYELSYARNLKKNYQVSENSKFGKILSIISAVVALPIIILSITTVVPYQQYQNILDRIKEVNAEEMFGMLAEIDDFEKHHSQYTDKINEAVYEEIKLRITKGDFGDASKTLAKINEYKKHYPQYADKIDDEIDWQINRCFMDGNYEKASEWLKALGKTKQANELIVWESFLNLKNSSCELAEKALITNLKDPASYKSYGRTFYYDVIESGNNNEVIIRSKVSIDYSATNSFGGRIMDTYVFDFPDMPLKSLGLSSKEVKEIVALEKIQMLNRCLK